MADRLRTDAALVRAASADLAARAGRIRGRTGTLSEEMDAVKRIWEGEAAGIFEREFRHELRRLEDVCAALEELARYEERASAIYRRCAERTGRMIAAAGHRGG